MSIQIATILNNLNAAVSRLTGGGASSADASSSLKDNQTTGSLESSQDNSVLPEPSTLVSKDASSAQPSATPSRTANLARQAGVTLQWATTAIVVSGLSPRLQHLVDVQV